MALRLLRAVFTIAALLFGFGMLSASAAEGDVSIDNVSIGFGDRFKVGHWTPVWVQLNAKNAEHVRIEVSVSDADGAEVAFSVGQFQDAALTTGPNRVLGYAKFGRIRAAMRVRIFQGEELTAQRTFTDAELPDASSSTEGLVLSLGPSTGIPDAIRRVGGDLEKAVFYEAEDFSDLPHDWFGYESVDLVTFVASDAAKIKGLRPEQLDALHEWIRMGGRFVLSCGREGEALLNGDGPLARFSPGKFVRTQALPSTTALEHYVEASQRLPQSHGLSVTILEDVRGTVELTESVGVSGSTIPLVARSPLGFGEVVWLAVDLDAKSLSSWQGRTPLTMQLVAGMRTGRPNQPRREELGNVSHLGYHDIVGQLRAALDQFSGVTVIRFRWIATFVVIYLVLIGPVDYFALRKLGISAHWTWVTFPLLACLFVGLAFWFNKSAKGTDRRMNQVDIVDLDVQNGMVRGTTWTHIFSPQEERIDVAFQPKPLARQSDKSASAGLKTLSSWSGLPGDGLGGLDATSETAPFTTAYSVKPLRQASAPAGGEADRSLAQLSQLPMYIGSTRNLASRWWGRVDLERVDKLETDEAGLLHGEVGNPFPQALNSCIVVFNGWVYRIETPLRPGERFSMDRARPYNLSWRLTQKLVVKASDVSTPWDEANTDIRRIIEIMMFYQASGGASYVRLTNRYQPYLDMSTRVQSDWAVLIGAADDVACDVTLNGEVLEKDRYEKWVTYRALFPVTAAKAVRK